MFNDKQKKFLYSLGLQFDFEKLSNEDMFEIENIVSQELQTKGFNIDYQPNEIGKICESILDLLS